MASSAGATSGTSVSVRPSARKSANRGTSSAVAGTISATSDAATTTPASRAARSWASANPASDATSTLSGTAIAATSSEFTRRPDQPAELERAAVALGRDGSGTSRASAAAAGPAGAASRTRAAAAAARTRRAPRPRPTVRAAERRRRERWRGRASGPSHSDRRCHLVFELEPPGTQAVRRRVEDPLPGTIVRPVTSTFGMPGRRLGPGGRAAGEPEHAEVGGRVEVAGRVVADQVGDRLVAEVVATGPPRSTCRWPGRRSPRRRGPAWPACSS